MADWLSSETGAVLFVDDDTDVLTAARVLLERNGLAMLAAQSPSEAWTVLAAQPVDVILLDLNFTRGATSGDEGFRWLAEIRAHDPDAVVVIVTGHSGVNIAVAAMKAGASDFVMKPWSNPRFLETVRAAQAVRRQRRLMAAREPEALDDDLLILGESTAIQRVRDLIGRVAPTGAAVLVYGEMGTGKSLVARNLHARSRRSGAFVRVDVAGLGGEGDIARAAVAAQGGTLFLDEIGALSPVAQAEVLALLDARSDVRWISASRSRPTGLRDGLVDQLATVEILLPSLAERDDDAALLAQHFVRLFSSRYGQAPKPLDAAVTPFLRAQPPPGEVRGLRLAAERAVVLGLGPSLTVADFAPSALSDTATPGQTDLNLSRSERAIVEAALKRHAHNVSQAARELGLTRAALYRRMVKHGL